ncbi:MAG: hypothetical protein R3304_09100 [Longimicrobiales bacterium]|nr:hypothetical protein [Longimicrobiales bacterium]
MYIPILSLWLPILLAAVLVFVASSIIHMFLGYHANDYRKLPVEDQIQDALQPFSIPPGDYVLPHAASAEEMKSEEYKAKVERGPAAFITVVDGRSVLNMGPQLTQWFVYLVVVGVFVAYAAGRTLSPGAEYLSVFRLTGTVAFACYAMSLPQRSVWYGVRWTSTLKSMFDGLIYALLTAGVFGWLWPVG